MDLTELYERLALGELSNLALAETGTVSDEKRPSVVLYINEGLHRLYNRFHLKQDYLLLELSGHRTRYLLDSRHALSNTDPSNTRIRYINDIGRPFTDDIVKVLKVDDVYGISIPLNKPGDPASLFTPRPDVLEVPYPQAGMPVAVTYQAQHPKLSVERPNQELELPEFLVGALSSYVAHKVFTHMNTQESTVKAAEHLAVFEAICVEAKEQDLITTGEATSSIRFDKNGWV